MARFNLVLIGRPRRWSAAQEERALAAASPTSREDVEAFLAGTGDRVLLVASDDAGRVTALWESCHGVGLEVCIFDHSTAWDRLKDRLRVRPVRRPVAQASAPAARDEGPALRDGGAMSLGPKARGALMAAGVFAVLLAAALSAVPDDPLGDASGAPAAENATPGGAAGSGALAAGGSGGGADPAAGPGPARNGGGGAAEAPPGGGGEVEARVGGGAGARGPAPAKPSGPGVVALLLSFVVGFAGAWAAGRALAPDGRDVTQLRGLRVAALAFALLVAAVSVVARLATPREAPAEPAPESSQVTAPQAILRVDSGADEPSAPFARFFHRRRAARVAQPPERFGDMLGRWRAERADASVPERDAALEATAEEPAPRENPEARAEAGDGGAGGRHHGRRHGRRHGSHRRRASRDAGVVTVFADASVAHVAPSASSPPEASPPAVVRAPLPRGDAGAPTAGEAVVVAAPPPRRAPVHREPRPPVSPPVSFALGVFLGVLTSPRWRRVARGGAA